MKVIDNFLPEYQFKQIQSTMIGEDFPWYFNDYICGNPKLYQFTHTFYKKKPPRNGISSTYYSLFDFCQTKLSVKYLHRIKANLNPRTIFHRNTGWHIDYSNEPPIKTSILYLNTNNGYTEIKGYGKVKSVANRMVIFDSNVKHAGVTCTDEKRRVVVNFNYEENS